MKLSDILLNEIRLDLQDDNSLTVDYEKVKQKDDAFLINGAKNSFKIQGVPTYYGISLNPAAKLADERVTDAYDNIKQFEGLDKAAVSRLVSLTLPDKKQPTLLIVIPSSAPLNAVLTQLLKTKFGLRDNQIVTNLEKLKYYIDDMLDQDTYTKADDKTRNMADTWVRGLKKIYPSDEELPIKKSKNKETGHPGLQSGARHLLKPSFNTKTAPGLKNAKINKHIVVLDDILVGGSTLREVYLDLMELGVNRSAIVGYTFATKKLKE